MVLGTGFAYNRRETRDSRAVRVHPSRRTEQHRNIDAYRRQGFPRYLEALADEERTGAYAASLALQST